MRGEAINHRSNEQHNNCSIYPISQPPPILGMHSRFISLSFYLYLFVFLFYNLPLISFFQPKKPSNCIFILLPFTPFSPIVLPSSSYLFKRCLPYCHSRPTWLLVFYYNGENRLHHCFVFQSIH